MTRAAPQRQAQWTDAADLEAPADPGDDRAAAATVHLFKTADAQTRSPANDPIGSRGGPDQLDLPAPRPWDSYFLWMFVTNLAVVLPFFGFATFVDLTRLEAWAQIATVAVLVATLALVNWFMVRPVRAVSQAAARVQAGDLRPRVSLVPTGAGVRVLSVTFNAMLNRLGAGLPERLQEANAGPRQTFRDRPTALSPTRKGSTR
jgi:methyl-accepting chemotaxis protein